MGKGSYCIRFCCRILAVASELSPYISAGRQLSTSCMLADFETLPKLVDTKSLFPHLCTFWPWVSSPREKCFQEGRGCALQLGGARVSVSECSHSACFANEVLQEIMVHFCKALRLCNNSQMIYAKSEAKFFQVLGTDWVHLWFEQLTATLSSLFSCFKSIT